jgi:hypothetical protein
MSYELPYFGQVDLTNLEDDYRVVSEISKSDIRLDLNFKNKIIAPLKADSIKAFLQNIETLDKQNKVIIEDDFKKEGETSNYINFYLEELEEEELIRVAGVGEGLAVRLLDKLKLIRVGCYPDNKYGTAYFGVFDYSIDIDGEPCEQLLVIKTDEHGNLMEVTWES